MSYKIYKITNKINNKQYIGRTKRRLDIRFKEHTKTNQCKLLYNAIQKYGIENFIIEEIDKVESLRDSIILESQYISKIGSYEPLGYNIYTDNTNKKSKITTSSKLQGNRNSWKSTDYIGVRKRGNRYSARVTKNNKVYTGSFTNLNEAIEFYDKMSLFLYGSDCKINLEENRSKYLSEDLEKFYNSYKPPIEKCKYTSKYAGVSFNKASNKWRASVTTNGKQTILKEFDDEESAAYCRDSEHFKIYKNLNKLNFPQHFKILSDANLGGGSIKDKIKNLENKISNRLEYCKIIAERAENIINIENLKFIDQNVIYVCAFLNESLQDSEITLIEVGEIFGEKVKNILQCLIRKKNESCLDFIQRIRKDQYGKIIARNNIQNIANQFKDGEHLMILEQYIKQ
jgi:group I intron endonuclease